MMEPIGADISSLYARAKITTLVSRWLAIGIVLAVGEVMIRFSTSTEIIRAGQLALATFANVALIGLLAIITGYVTLVTGKVLVSLLYRNKPFPSRIDQLTSVVLVAVVVFIATDGAGLRPWITEPGVWVGGLLVGLITGKWLVRKNAESDGLSLFARMGVMVAWVVCLSLTALSVNQTQRQIHAWVTSSHPNLPQTKSTSPNIILVVLDTLRADRVGRYGDQTLTPHLDEIAQSSITYTQAVSTAPWTLPTHASLFTGLYPDRHGVNWGNYKLSEQEPVLAEHLRGVGYETFAISNNWLLSKQNGFARGFDSFIELPLDSTISVWRLTLQCRTMRHLLPWLGIAPQAGFDAGGALTQWLLDQRLARSTDSPSFTFVNYFEVHDPYKPPPAYRDEYLTTAQQKSYLQLSQNEYKLAAHACGAAKVFNPSQIDLLRALYDVEVIYQDALIGQLWSTLKRCNLLDNTWLIITSDHGELFGEGEGVYHTAGSHWKLLHVPLLVRPPGGVEARVVNSPVQPVDLFATIMQAASVAMPAQVTEAYPLPLTPEASPTRKYGIAQSHGASLAGLSMAQRYNMQVDYSRWLNWVETLFDGNYLLQADQDGPHGLYLVTTDPRMEDNLISTHPQIATKLWKILSNRNERVVQGEPSWKWAVR